MSQETREKLSSAHLGNTSALGHHCSDESKMKNISAHLGVKASPETRAKMSLAQRGSLSKRWKGGRKLTWIKAHAKRRLLGFHPLNSPFPGCEGHHINPQDVIYIPRALHQSVRHNLWTGKNMGRINALAGQYMAEGWT